MIDFSGKTVEEVMTLTQLRAHEEILKYMLQDKEGGTIEEVAVFDEDLAAFLDERGARHNKGEVRQEAIHEYLIRKHLGDMEVVNDG